MVEKASMADELELKSGDFPVLIGLARDFFGTERLATTRLKGDGSDRAILRFTDLDRPDAVVVGINHHNIQENKDFIFLCKTLHQMGFPVPEIKRVSSDLSAYLIEDLGDSNLADRLAEWNQSTQLSLLIPKAYKRVLRYLVEMQQGVVAAIPEFFKNRKMNKTTHEADLEYYRAEFLSRFGFENLETEKTREEIRSEIVDVISALDLSVFVYRDFQSRNIMWQNEAPYFIDFQSAYRGPRYYDLASLLYSSKSFLTDGVRLELLRFYYEIAPVGESWDEFNRYFYLFVIMRRIRSLGSYAYLSEVKNKRHFLASIAPTLAELDLLLKTQPSIRHLACLSKTIERINEEWNEDYEGRAEGFSQR